MARVIAVQEEQLKMLRENYTKNVVNVAPSFNNASVLSDSLSNGVENNVVVTPVVPQVDMESQSVNLNPFEVQPNAAPVISNEVTNEVFGPQVDSVPVSNVTNGVGEVNLFGNVGNNVLSSGNDNLPYQEPVMNNANLETEMNDDFYNDYIKDLNALRDKLTANYNDILLEIDKLQEKLNQKTGANLLSAGNQTVANNVGDSQPVANNEIPMNGVGSGVIGSPSGNIFDADKTFVTNDFRQEIANARNEMENSVMKVA